jgi:hypothetical protein
MWRQTRRRYQIRHPEREILSSAKCRAKRLSLPFDLVEEDIVIPAVCPVLGIPVFKGAGKICDNSPTLDRIQPDRGYVKGNVAVVSQRANVIKNCGSAEEHERIAAWIRSHDSRTN